VKEVPSDIVSIWEIKGKQDGMRNRYRNIVVQFATKEIALAAIEKEIFEFEDNEGNLMEIKPKVWVSQPKSYCMRCLGHDHSLSACKEDLRTC